MAKRTLFRVLTGVLVVTFLINHEGHAATVKRDLKKDDDKSLDSLNEELGALLKSQKVLSKVVQYPAASSQQSNKKQPPASSQKSDKKQPPVSSQQSNKKQPPVSSLKSDSSKTQMDWWKVNVKIYF